MAKIYPANIEGYQKATEGERRVFRFLKMAARPDSDFICFYEPLIGSSGKEPDFILLGRKLGLVIIEVKDWTSKQITSYNPHRFTVLISGKPQKKTNPDRQAKGYADTLKEQLSNIPEFLSEDIKHKGNLKIPVGRMVAFPNISRDEYAESGFKWFIDSERIIFKEDLDAAGEILCDVTGKLFFIPYAFILLMILMFAMVFIVNNLRIGRSVYAVGGNSYASLISGIRVNWVLVRVYIISAVLAGIAGVFLAAYSNVGFPRTARGFELIAITTVVMGGIPFTGGEGNLWNGLFAVVVLRTLNKLLLFSGLSGYIEGIILGSIIIFTLYLNSNIRSSRFLLKSRK